VLFSRRVSLWVFDSKRLSSFSISLNSSLSDSCIIFFESLNHFRGEISIFDFMFRDSKCRDNIVIILSFNNCLSLSFFWFLFKSLDQIRGEISVLINRVFRGDILRRNVIVIFICDSFSGFFSGFCFFISISGWFKSHRITSVGNIWSKIFSWMNLLFNSDWFSDFHIFIIGEFVSFLSLRFS
jgi:hypothetical protein